MNQATTEQRRRSLVEVVFAGSIWGLAFVTTVWALPGIGPMWMTSVRFLIAVVVLDLLFRSRIAGLEPLRYSRRGFMACVWPGFFLFANLSLQTWGLKYTTPTKSGFITVLYVLMVPFLERFFIGRRIAATVWVWIGLALTGTALICGALTFAGFAPDFMAAFNFGDGLTLLCAIAAAAHIVVVGRLMNGGSAGSTAQELAASPVKFHLYQCTWIVLFASIAGWAAEGTGWFAVAASGGWSLRIWLSLGQLGILSSALAFLIQVRAQRFLPSTTVGLLVLLESPWAMFFSILLLDERLSHAQLLGAGLILIAAVAECIQQARVSSPAEPSSH